MKSKYKVFLFIKHLFLSSMLMAYVDDRLKLSTLDLVKKRGRLRCGVSQGLAGFSSPDQSGSWSGIDVDFCRAVAAAIFADSRKVHFVSLSAKERFTSLQSGDIDILSRNTTWTLSRDTDLGFDFVAITF